MPNYVYSLLWLFFLVGCAQSPKQPLTIVQTLPAIAAEFETLVKDEHDAGKNEVHRWRFWRTAKRIETLNLDDNSGEIWEQTNAGEIAYQRLFHSHHQIIDYVPGDLKSMNLRPDWMALSSLLNQRQRDALRGGAYERLLDRPALRYREDDAEQPTEVSWLIQEQVPAIIDRHEQSHKLKTRLIAVYPLSQAPWQAPNHDDYRRIDFSDIGDKENDPFIKSILPKIKGTHQHEITSQ